MHPPAKPPKARILCIDLTTKYLTYSVFLDAQYLPFHVKTQVRQANNGNSKQPCPMSLHYYPILVIQTLQDLHLVRLPVVMPVAAVVKRYQHRVIGDTMNNCRVWKQIKMKLVIPHQDLPLFFRLNFLKDHTPAVALLGLDKG
jgi:hypothetical protein